MPAGTSLRRTFWVLQIGGWLAFVAALLLPWLGAYPVRAMLANKAPLALTGFATSLLLRWLYQRLLRRDASLWLLGAVAVLASWAGSRLWAAAAGWLAERSGRAIERGSLIGASIERFDDSLYFMLVLVTWSLIYLAIAHHQALFQERERSLRAESLAHQAQLEALRYQVNPHFLFNTLNAISTLVVERRTEEAGRMLARLSDFLRVTLQRPGADEIPLRDEIAFARQYLELEQVRFGDRLSVLIEVDPAASEARVPGLILQPLIENAVRHAVAQSERGGRISIRAALSGEVLSLCVADDGPGVPGATGEGIGLTNIRARLRELYGKAHRFELRSPPGGGVTVLIELPFLPALEVRPKEASA